jgi:quercetin dioxygenase-like cupin family protein
MPSKKPRSLKTSGEFHFSSGARQKFQKGLREYFVYRDLGMEEATGGALQAHQLRAVPGQGVDSGWHKHKLGFQMVYVLKGWVIFEYEGVGRKKLTAGSCVYQPPGIKHREIEHSDDLDMLEITSPAQFKTFEVKAPKKAVKKAAKKAVKKA